MKNITRIASIALSLISSYAFSQNIASSLPVTVPVAPATEHTVNPGNTRMITSSMSVTLRPGTHFRSGSDVTVKIMELAEERLPIIYASPSININQDYAPLLNDDFNDVVQPNTEAINNQYIDVTLYFPGKAELTRVSLFDGIGSMGHPVTVYALNGSDRTLIGTFDGTSNWAFVNFSIVPSIHADALVIHKYGNDLPIKIQAYGRLLPGTLATSPLSISLVDKQNITCFGSANGKITVVGNGGNIVYKAVFNSESTTKGDPIYQYSLNGATYQKSGVFDNLAAGTYTVYVRDAFSFIQQLTVQIAEPSALQLAENVTPLDCSGACIGAISIASSGGTAPYSYEWLGRPDLGNNVGVSNLCAGIYTVRVTDANGCKAEKIITLNSGAVQFAGINDVVLCKDQKVQLTAGNPGATYSWTSTNGFSSAQQSVEVSQAGDYNLTVTNSSGCAQSRAFKVTTSLDAFKAEFLVSTVVNVGDTIHVIDITKPSPTSINWTLPSGMHEISANASGSIKQIVFDAIGDYNISMTASRGECTDIVTKSVKVLERTAKTQKNTALGYQEELIKKIIVSPNPTSGQFEVKIELSRVENVQVRLLSFFYNHLIEMKQDVGKSTYEIAFNHPEVAPGVYFIVVEIGTVVKTLKLIKL